MLKNIFKSKAQKAHEANQMLNMIETQINHTNDVLLKQFKKYVLNYFNMKNMKRAVYEITDINYLGIENKIIGDNDMITQHNFEIVCCRPKYLIGENGSFINGLVGYCNNKFNQKLNINVVKSTLWSNLNASDKTTDAEST